MQAGQRFPLLLVTLLLVAWPVHSIRGDVRHYQDQNGVTWREETVKVPRPVRELTLETQQQQVYRPQDTTTVQNYSYTTYSPVVQYQWVPRVHGWWRIWADPQVMYHLEPTVSWQARPYQISMPVTQRQWIAETRTVQVPVARLKMVEKEETIRTAVQSDSRWLAQQSPAGVTAPQPSIAPPAIYQPPAAAQGPFGGIARLDDGLPRAGTSEGWHPLR